MKDKLKDNDPASENGASDPKVYGSLLQKASVTKGKRVKKKSSLIFKKERFFFSKKERKKNKAK